MGTATKNDHELNEHGEGVALAQRTWADVNPMLPLTPDVAKEYALHQVGAANHDGVAGTEVTTQPRDTFVY